LWLGIAKEMTTKATKSTKEGGVVLLLIPRSSFVLFVAFVVFF